MPLAKQIRTHSQKNTLFTKKKNAGLNIEEPEAHNIRIRHMFTLKEQQKPPSWN